MLVRLHGAAQLLRASGITRRLVAFALVAFALLSPALAFAEGLCVQPSEEVVTAVVIRKAATTASTQLARLAPGTRAQVVGEVPHWYRVVHGDDRDGFVSKAWTELVTCPDETADRRFEVHVIDVGTGLSVFVHGDDFDLLYDAGSNDDLAAGARNRVLAYLRRVAPDLARIDHVVVSHPHRDHVGLLPDLLAAYDVGDLWSSGATNATCIVRDLYRATSGEPALRYHDGLRNHGASALEYAAGCSHDAESLALRHGRRIDVDPIQLGAGASMQFLYVDGKTRSDLNDNSLVLRLDLDRHRILLMGDAGGGGRDAPSVAPKPLSVEGVLLGCCRRELRADVVVIGHHGSRTSSRNAFIQATGARTFVVSSGPMAYSGTVLPDADVVAALDGRGTVWRTDRDDAACAASVDKVGEAADGKPGGCDNVRMTLTPERIRTEYWPAH